MNAIVYYLVLPIIYLFSLLPFKVIYWISNCFYVLFFHVIGYRKEVVFKNLRNSFPEKTDQEIVKIAKDFYKYFCDLILETIKTLTISPGTLKKHVIFKETSIFKKLFDQNQSAIIVMGHFGNWELAGAAFSQLPFHKLHVIYHPLSNKYFDKLFYYMRTRLGNKLYAMNDVLRGMIKDRDKSTLTAFIADQTPSPNNAYWTVFLNQETPVFTGTEKIAKKLNYPIIYVTMKRPKRGYYEIESELLVSDSVNTLENEISELHTRKLEKDIIAQPEIWLWTHRRWKHKKN